MWHTSQVPGILGEHMKVLFWAIDHVSIHKDYLIFFSPAQPEVQVLRGKEDFHPPKGIHSLALEEPEITDFNGVILICLEKPFQFTFRSFL